MHHVRKVLRGRTGDAIEVVDAGRKLFLAGLLDDGRAAILEELETSGETGEVGLYQAVPKGRHMDLVVEKATELGVDRVTPLTTERGVVRLEPGDKKAGRWRRVAEAAARQSLRLRVPEVEEPRTLADAVREVGETGVLLHNGAGLPVLEEVVAGSPVNVFVGPEGGWSDAEFERAVAAGFIPAQLGPYRLRSETAGIVGVARARAALDALDAQEALSGEYRRGAGRG